MPLRLALSLHLFLKAMLWDSVLPGVLGQPQPRGLTRATEEEQASLGRPLPRPHHQVILNS